MNEKGPNAIDNFNNLKRNPENELGVSEDLILENMSKIALCAEYCNIDKQFQREKSLYSRISGINGMQDKYLRKEFRFYKHTNASGSLPMNKAMLTAAT